MKLKVFTIFDNAVKAFNNPFYMLTRAEAIRAFTIESNSNDSKIAMSPHDYSLYFIGNYDTETGQIDQTDGLVNLGSALTFIKKADQEESKTQHMEMVKEAVQ